MGLEGPFGFGCADFGPGRCFNTDRGFLFHGSIIQQYPCCLLNKLPGWAFRAPSSRRGA